ncbi:Nucleolar protein Nop56 [Giardia duodenalis assemblage B]|uniref:Nucleolar protein Nop56 n=2 Tax=Giardia intestinalis TaxID=5741 RepID=A0A132P1S4_GIAIN|nr:Nucleolar protein Nop56 [Giardia intestinalis]KWX15932.1 Nucleolar protein Nop56 [Giardia intestinalis assemblage B]
MLIQTPSTSTLAIRTQRKARDGNSSITVAITAMKTAASWQP